MNSSQCTIFNKFLQDDLSSYSLQDNSGGPLEIVYKNGEKYPVDINLDAIKKLYTDSALGDERRVVNTWYPVFVWDDEFVENKFLTKEGAIKNANSSLKSGRLGIEEIISFKPIFDNWSISDESILFSSDWMLNRPNFPYSLEYGLLFWYKRFPLDESPIDEVRYLYSLDDISKFPNYSKLSTNGNIDGIPLTNVTLIKLNNSTLYRVDQDDSRFIFSQYESTRLANIDFNSKAIINLSDLNPEAKFFLFSQEGLNNDEILKTESRASLWIPNGDFFSYFENQTDKAVSYEEKAVSKSYISPSLYKNYRQIYHILTLDDKKLVNKGYDLRKARIIKKLSYLLSTSPIMSEIGINFLDFPVLREHIQNRYINNEDLEINDLDSEIRIVIEASNYIHNYLNKDPDVKFTKIDNKLSQKTINGNIVNSRKQLFEKILKKYGGYINIQKDCKISYKNKLKNGDDLNFNQTIYNYCDKNLENTNVFNNQSISLGLLKSETKIDETRTDIELKKQGIETKTIPLSDLVRKPFPKLNLVIQMEKSSNVESQYRKNPEVPQGETEWSTSYIFYTQNVPFAQQRTSETELHFRILDTAAFNTEDAIERIFSDPTEKISVVWEKVYGDCVRFTDSNKTPETLGTRLNPAFQYERYQTSTQIDPYVYVYKTGEYKIKCTVSTPNGTFVKTKTFYVVIGTEVLPSDGDVPIYGYYTDIGESDPVSIWDYENSGTEKKEYVKLELKPPEGTNTAIQEDGQPVQIGSDNLKIVCPSLTDIAFNKLGIFWPRKTLLSYANDTLSEFMENYKLEGEDKFFFGRFGEEELIKGEDSELVLEYKPNNTKMAVSRFALFDIRNEKETCQNCLSFYKPVMTTQAVKPPPTTITNDTTGEVEIVPSDKQVRSIRNHKGPDGSLSLIRFKIVNDKFEKDGSETFVYPQVSNKYAPKIKTYGGYTPETQETLGLFLPQVSAGEEFPSVTGYRMDYPPDPIPNFSFDESEMKACFQRSISPGKKYINFSKGVFHPASGFILPEYPDYDDIKNLSSVLKFNPGARDTFSFTGPGLYGLNSSFDSKNVNKPRVYQSSIELKISDDVQWDPLFAPCDAENIDELREQKRIENQLNKEYLDQLDENAQSMKHGYRYLEGGFFKLAETARSNNEVQVCDEFGFSSSNNRNCNSENFDSSVSHTYSFPVTGPNYKINQENKDKTNIRDPRINDFQINDIEVKLNFLNYVNTKNLVVWLDVYYSEHELRATRKGNPINTQTEFVNQSFPGNLYGFDYNTKTVLPKISDVEISGSIKNDQLLGYLNDLVLTNSTEGSPQRIYLLNQDHIQNNEYNFSLKFSDHASNFNSLNDENSANSLGLNRNQNIIQHEYEIQPTISCSGHSDRESAVCKNIIRNNQLNIINNKFAKFKNRILFQTPIPEEQIGATCQYDPKYDSSTKFVLNIAVLDEADEMLVYDTIYNGDFLSGYETGVTKNISSDIYSSLCSWELVLDVGKTKKYVPSSLNGINNYGSSNALSMIDYGNEPKYPGYSFIADLKNVKNLIPNINVNAPNPFLYVPNLSCDFADPVDKPKISDLIKPDFPDWAIASILSQMLMTALLSGGSLVGLSTALSASFSPGYAALFTFLRSNRIYQEALDKLRNFYVPKYESYPFGSPEKALLNISKDGVFWYKLEASIFKYDNTPILKNNTYKYIKIKKNTFPIFSDWKFNSIKNIRNLIDDHFIHGLSIDCEEIEDDGITTELLKRKGAEENKILQVSLDIQCEQLSGLYIINNGITYALSLKDAENNTTYPQNLLYSNEFVQYNNVVSGNSQKSLFNDFLQSDLDDNKVIIFDSKIPFYIFNVDNLIEAYDNSEDEQAIETKILAKNLIMKDNKFYTVLLLENDITSKNYVSLKDSDCLLLFKSQSTEVFDYPINVWGLEKEKVKVNRPEIYSSTNSIGSIGDGSYETEKTVLDYIPSVNNIDNLYKILNNVHNDKIKYNNVYMTDINNKKEDIQVTRGLSGFSINIQESRELFHNFGYLTRKNPNTKDEEFNKVLDSLLYTVSNPRIKESQLMILKSSDFVESETENYGEISIEQDFIKEEKIQDLTQDQVTLLETRLNHLESIEKTELDQSIGVKTSTDQIIKNGTIKNLIDHFNALDEDDIECFNKYNKSSALCYKKRTKQALYNSYEERNSIIQLLNLKAKIVTDEETRTEIVPDNGNTTDTTDTTIGKYIPKIETQGLKYTISVDIKKFEDTDTTTDETTGTKVTDVKNIVRNSDAIKIEYNHISSDYYWINIDPKQACTIASELSPRVLTKTKYSCKYAYNDSLTFPVNNNVCPRFATSSQGFKSSFTQLNDVNLDSAGNEFTFEIPQKTIEAEKEEIEKLHGDKIDRWETITIERSFTVNNDSDIASSNGGIFISYQDIIVDAIETYEIAIPKIDYSDDGSGDGVEKKEQTDEQGNAIINSSPRVGLMDFTGSRLTKPIRVHNVFNLDDTNDLKVQFRKIPRMIKGVDYRNTVNRYGISGSIFRPIVGDVPPLEVATSSSLNNLFYYWQCIQRNEYGDWKYTTLPDLYKLFNEMEYRGFFGSTDHIEYKDRILESLYPWEIIPYEYDNINE